MEVVCGSLLVLNSIFILWETEIRSDRLIYSLQLHSNMCHEKHTCHYLSQAPKSLYYQESIGFWPNVSKHLALEAIHRGLKAPTVHVLCLTTHHPLPIILAQVPRFSSGNKSSRPYHPVYHKDLPRPKARQESQSRRAHHFLSFQGIYPRDE